MGENNYGGEKFWGDQSLPIAKELSEKMQELCDNLERAEACTSEMYCWIRNVQLEFSKMPEL